jgi:hypothetical protein
MASHDRKILETWAITDAGDMQAAIAEAQELVAAEGSDAYLSFLVMTKADSNVDEVRLVKIDLTDSFAYELELA